MKEKSLKKSGGEGKVVWRSKEGPNYERYFPSSFALGEKITEEDSAGVQE